MRHLSFDALPTVLQPSLVKQAYSVIRHKITKTPLLMNERISSIASRPSFSAYHEAQRAPNIQVYLKCENFQKTGSFKYRGVAHSIARLSDEELRRGLLTTSSGEQASISGIVLKLIGYRQSCKGVGNRRSGSGKGKTILNSCLRCDARKRQRP
jgi:predicted alternative tryptophan synthase beta-subunit